MSEPNWKKGRGKLGVFAPLLGSWRHASGTGDQAMSCERTFSLILMGKFVRLEAHWLLADDKTYDEVGMFGALPDGGLGFWSFTSDGKRSEGWLSSAPDVHESALCFEADMEAGRARQVYWPGDNGTMNWAVESATRKGWNRFTEAPMSVKRLWKLVCYAACRRDCGRFLGRCSA